jgi:hypothetical protein
MIQQVNSIDAGHSQVQQQHIDRCAFQHLDRFFTGVRRPGELQSSLTAKQ